jgi:tetratricopeptide (TPR) repeat protein
LEFARYQDARRHLVNLFAKVSTESKDQPLVAELEDLLGQCERGLANYTEAEKWFVQAIRHDPHRVDCYDRLARLRRADLRRLESAVGTIADMVANNPKTGRAYIYRWRYSLEFLPPADASNIQIALTFAPDDSEVLLTAAIASERRADAASARGY